MQAATTLIILDGFGHREESDANAIALANTPFLDSPVSERTEQPGFWLRPRCRLYPKAKWAIPKSGT